MPKEKVDVLVYPEELAATGEPQVVPPFPGVFPPGEPVALDDLGLTQTEAKQLIKDGNLPLKLDKATVGKAEEPPIAGRHYDAEELEPGEAVPLLTGSARVASGLEGVEIGEKPPPSAEPTPLEAEAVAEAIDVHTEETQT